MTRRLRPPAPDGPLGLLIVILRGAPRLPGARCRDRADLFDATHAIGRGASSTRKIAAARAAAAAECAQCPALVACSAWVDGLRPAHRPSGVVAGRITNHRPSGERN